MDTNEPGKDPYGLKEVPADAINRGGQWHDAVIANRDGESKLERVFVTIRPMDDCESGLFSEKLGNAADFVAFVCEKDKDWVNSLTITSQEDLLRLGRELNFPTLLRWAERNQESMRIVKTVMNLVGGNLLQIVSPLLKLFGKLQTVMDDSSTKSTTGESVSTKS